MLRLPNLREDVQATGFKLPAQYERIAELGLRLLPPWSLLDPESGPAGVRSYLAADETLRRRYPSRLVVPFARRDDTDDVACFVVRDGNKMMGAVLVINQNAHAGFEVRTSTDFWGWLRGALEHTIERVEDDIGGTAA